MEQFEPDVLTNDEKKAAEAAFQGLPINPAWTTAALEKYKGIREAMGKSGIDTVVIDDTPALTL